MLVPHRYAAQSAIVTAALFLAATASAQQPISQSAPLPGSQSAPQPGSSAGTASAPMPGDTKLDVSGIEKKYWAAKDTDFSVVQNRTYTKAGRLAATLQYGASLNDTYGDVKAYRLGANYYFSERYGIELNYETFDTVNSTSTSYFISHYGGVYPNHNVTRAYYGATFNWVPIYAKMSLLGSRIIYFDMAFSPGIGMTSYEQQVQGSNPTATAPTLSFDVSQHFFLSNNFAIRVDYQNRWYNEDVKDFRNQTPSSSNYNPTSILLIGGQLFF